VNIRDVDAIFNDPDVQWTTNCVTYHYLMGLWQHPPIKTSDTGKMIVEACRPGVDVDKGIEQLLNVAVIHKPFDFSVYETSGRRPRKQMVLDFLHDGLVELAEHKGWPTDAFKSAREKVIEDGFRCVGGGTKAVVSPNEGRTAQVAWEFDVDRIVLEVLVWEADGTGHRIRFDELRPGGLFLYEALGELVWQGNRKVKVRNRCGDSVRVVNVGW